MTFEAPRRLPTAKLLRQRFHAILPQHFDHHTRPFDPRPTYHRPMLIADQ
jgi:hypothetical protein